MSASGLMGFGDAIRLRRDIEDAISRENPCSSLLARSFQRITQLEARLEMRVTNPNSFRGNDGVESRDRKIEELTRRLTYIYERLEACGLDHIVKELESKKPLRELTFRERTIVELVRTRVIVNPQHGSSTPG